MNAQPATEEKSPGFLRWWLATRQYSDLKLAIPAMVAALTLAGVSTLALVPVADQTTETYLRLAAEASQQGNARLAALYTRKASRITKVESPDDQFRRGLDLAKAGKMDEAYALINSLAADGGNKSVHEWLLHYHIDAFLDLQGNREPSAEDGARRKTHFEKAEAHATKLLDIDSNHPHANEVMAKIHVTRGDVKAAIKNYENISELNENDRVGYARLLLAAGRDEEAKRQAREAVSFHQRALEGELTEQQSEHHRLQLATAYGLLEQYEQAAGALILDGMPPTSTAMRNMLANVMVAAANQHVDGTAKSQIKRLELLERTLRLVPDHPAIVASIGEFVSMEGEVGQRAETALKQILATGNASWIAHFALGMRAHQAKDHDRAELHFEQALRINPNTLITLNNLAHTMAIGEHADLDRALSLIERALKEQPDNPAFHDTRGLIYAKQHRWSDAIRDLEYALKRIPSNIESHRALAQAYEAAGDSELAKQHRAAVQNLQRSGGR